MVLKKVRKWTKVWILLFLNYLNRLLSYEFDRHPCIRKPACKAQIINNIKLMEICYNRTQVCHFHKPYTVAMFHFHAQQASRNPKTIHERIIRLSNNQLERSFCLKNLTFQSPRPSNETLPFECPIGSGLRIIELLHRCCGELMAQQLYISPEIWHWIGTVQSV